jgi:hypothetical protein
MKYTTYFPYKIVLPQFVGRKKTGIIGRQISDVGFRHTVHESNNKRGEQLLQSYEELHRDTTSQPEHDAEGAFAESILYKTAVECRGNVCITLIQEKVCTT